MKLSEIPTSELLDILRGTEAIAGSDSVEVRILRREIIRRADRPGPPDKRAQEVEQ